MRVREENDATELVHLLEHGELDLAFAELPLPDGPFEWAELLQDPYVLLVSARSELAELDAAPSLREVGKLPLLGRRSTDEPERHLAGRVPDLNVVFRTDDNGTLQALVAEGLGVAIEPRLVVDQKDRAVKMLPFGTRIPPRTIVLAWHRDRYRSQAAQAFVELAQELASSSARAGCGGGGDLARRDGPPHGTVTRGPTTPVCTTGTRARSRRAGRSSSSCAGRATAPRDASVVVAKDGSYSVSLAPGVYTVTVSHAADDRPRDRAEHGARRRRAHAHRRLPDRYGDPLVAGVVVGEVAVRRATEARDDGLLRALVQPLAAAANRGEEALEIDLEGGELVVGPVLHLHLHLVGAAASVLDDLVGLPLGDLDDLRLRRLAHGLLARLGEEPVDLALRLGEHLLPLLDDPAGLLDLFRDRRPHLVDDVVDLLAVDTNLVGERDGLRVVNEVVELVDQNEYVHCAGV